MPPLPLQKPRVAGSCYCRTAWLHTHKQNMQSHIMNVTTRSQAMNGAPEEERKTQNQGRGRKGERVSMMTDMTVGNSARLGRAFEWMLVGTTINTSVLTTLLLCCAVTRGNQQRPSRLARDKTLGYWNTEMQPTTLGLCNQATGSLEILRCSTVLS